MGVSAFALLVAVLAAQMPARTTDVDVPGLGLKLKVGWMLLVGNECVFSVPRSWKVDPAGTIATGPDGSTLTVTALHATGPAYRTRLRAMRGSTTIVHQDDDERLWIESRDDARFEHQIVVGGGAAACLGVLDLRHATPAPDEVARTIAGSIGISPPRWPPSSR
jgi:hypothetical protein